ncbi:hypothetical protein PHISCL_08623 [Aspergillus sclerotialis]|uniref:DNA/RNA-binding domain-containing protein n=1 Tax=Aspergillus sclerotialis TaxID=2070753 RepID=A0A3A2Z8U5_9EURO|nr:hypothetical protein PHISCL_08623 [Aspergillus sclerotialis]
MSAAKSSEVRDIHRSPLGSMAACSGVVSNREKRCGSLDFSDHNEESAEKRLADKVYADLVVMEEECTRFCRRLSKSQAKISHPEWQQLSGLHCTLLEEHYDFYLASQLPEASPAIMELAENEVPARLWNIGINQLLELQSYRRPDSLEHMLTFIHFSYSMLTLLLDTVPRFELIWMECLGDLARYRMAIVADSPGYEFWSRISRYWYCKKMDEAPESGRIQHHLGVLCQRDIVQRLYYYTKAYISVHPFPARESILPLFDSANQRSTPNQDQVATLFVRVHGQLFTQGVTNQAIKLAGSFLSDLEIYIGRMGAAFRLKGVYIMSANFAAVFKYGQVDALLSAKFNQSTELANFSICQSDSETPARRLETVKSNINNSSRYSQLAFSLSLAFQTFSIALDQIGNKNVYPTIHITLAFIWCLALNGDTIKHVEIFIPWSNLAAFLNTMIRDITNIRVIESKYFPVFEGGRKQVPEDFCIRGQSWSKNYYPPDFFKRDPGEDDERFVEEPSLNMSRAYRCLWLGVQVAQFNRWLVYDSTSQRFSATTFSLEQKTILQFLSIRRPTLPYNSLDSSEVA